MSKNQYLKVLQEKLSDFIKSDREYNVSITSRKFEVSEVKTTKTTINDILIAMQQMENRFNQRLDKLEQDMFEVKSDIKAMKNTPTMEKELEIK